MVSTFISKWRFDLIAWNPSIVDQFESMSNDVIVAVNLDLSL